MSTSAGMLLLVYMAVTGDTARECPMHVSGSAKRASEVDKRGDAVMGFAHHRSRHAFRLAKDGGTIEVNALSERDQQTVKQIRMHMRSIASRFAAGDFSSPRKIHNGVVPGTPVMTAKKSSISFRYADTHSGGRVKIETADAEALSAVHSFLKFQIEDHRTGDSKQVSN